MKLDLGIMSALVTAYVSNNGFLFQTQMHMVSIRRLRINKYTVKMRQLDNRRFQLLLFVTCVVELYDYYKHDTAIIIISTKVPLR